MDLTGIQAIVNASNTVVNWCMSMIAASLLAILSTSYIKPVGKWARLIYLAFIPGWFWLTDAIRWGNSLTRRGIMATLYPDRIAAITEKMNDEFQRELSGFYLALVFFCCWLLLYLLWWIFQDFFSKTK